MTIRLISDTPIIDTTQTKSVGDLIINAGSLFLIDLLNPDCVDLTQPLSEGQVIGNLVSGAPNGILKTGTTMTRSPTASATVVGGAVTAIGIVDGGAGFSVAPPVLIVGGGGSGATATCTIVGGVVSGVTITAAGAGYTSIPTVVIGGAIAIPGKGIMLGSASLSAGIQMDNGAQYFQSNLSDLVMLSTIVTIPAADPAASAGFLFSKNNGAAYSGNGPGLAARIVGNGGNPDMVYRFDSSAGVGRAAAPSAVAGKHQFASSGGAGSGLAYVDGAAVSTANASFAGAIVASANPLFWGGNRAGGVCIPGTVLGRAYAEDLTISGKTAAGQVSAENSNTARF